MWSTEEIIKCFKEHRQVCAQISIMESSINCVNNEQGADKECAFVLMRQYNELLSRKNMVISWLQLLPTEEKFLVQTHLIDGLYWAKTIVEHEKMWGIINGRSERTLKRIQAKAIDRVVSCLNHIETMSLSNRNEVK